VATYQCVSALAVRLGKRGFIVQQQLHHLHVPVLGGKADRSYLATKAKLVTKPKRKQDPQGKQYIRH
jgi:hypothetical protein